MAMVSKMDTEIGRDMPDEPGWEPHIGAGDVGAEFDWSDPVLEASWESFPASDAPAWAVGAQVWPRSPANR